MTDNKMIPSAINEKLMHIQTELKAPKNLYNSFGKYHYRNAEGIQEALKPLESKYNVTVTLSDEIVEVGGRVYVKTTATITDVAIGESVSVSAYAREALDKKGMDDAQVTGATSSYARKYALNGLFLLDDTKDVDTEEYQTEGKQAAKREPAKKEPDYRSILREFIRDTGLDPKAIAQTCGLTQNSSNEEWKKALDYAKSLVTG